MARNVNYKVAIPTKFGFPKFGLRGFYRQTRMNTVGNVFRSISGIGQFYRQSAAYLPSAVRSDLTNCPAAAAGQACPIAPPQIPGAMRTGHVCSAKATGHACPFGSGSASKPRWPKFGLSGLGQGSTGYVDASGYSVDPSGNIFDNYGNQVYQAGSGATGNFGPFFVDTDGGVLLGNTNTVIWDPVAGLVATAPTASTAATKTATATATTAAPVPGSSFFGLPTGYAQPTATAPPTSWWNGSTSLFGTTIQNSTLAIGGGIAALAAVILGGKKRR